MLKTSEEAKNTYERWCHLNCKNPGALVSCPSVFSRHLQFPLIKNKICTYPGAVHRYICWAATRDSKDEWADLIMCNKHLWPRPVTEPSWGRNIVYAEVKVL